MRIRHDSADNYCRDSQACQRDITMLQRTAESWCLFLNLKKCVVIRFERKSHALPPPSYHLNQTMIQVVKSHTDLGVLIDADLKFHQHVASTVQKAAGLTQNLLRSTVCRSPDFMLTLFNAHVRPIIEYCSCVWHTAYLGDVRLLESVQRRWTKRISGMADLDYESRLRALNQYSVQGRLLRADLIQYWKIFHAKCSIDPAAVFELVHSSGTRGHRFKIRHTRVQTDVRSRSFSKRCIAAWNALPDKVIAESDLSRFKAMLADSMGDALFSFHT